MADPPRRYFNVHTAGRVVVLAEVQFLAQVRYFPAFDQYPLAVIPRAAHPLNLQPRQRLPRPQFRESHEVDTFRLSRMFRNPIKWQLKNSC
jgi:hypothetical protein